VWGNCDAVGEIKKNAVETDRKRRRVREKVGSTGGRQHKCRGSNGIDAPQSMVCVWLWSLQRCKAQTEQSPRG